MAQPPDTSRSSAGPRGDAEAVPIAVGVGVGSAGTFHDQTNSNPHQVRMHPNGLDQDGSEPAMRAG